MFVFDIETDGFLEDLTKIHCVNLIDRTTGKSLAFNGGIYSDGTPAPRDGTIEEGLELLANADCVAGHNIIRYDIPAIQKLHPQWKPPATVIDTLVCANVIYTNVADRDFNAMRKGTLSKEFQKMGLIGKQSLEAWGMRLGVLKTVYDWENDGKWQHFTKTMDDYARQDPVVNLALLEQIESKQFSPECLDLEHAVARIVWKQCQRGWAVSVTAMEALTAKLQKRHAEINAQLTSLFQPWFMPDVAKGTATFTPKKDDKKRGYTALVPFSRVKQVVFNPASRDHIADRLMKVRGWVPTQFTDGGKPKVDETVLESLSWPEAKALAEGLMIEKRIGQVATGNEAWLKAVRDGRIHGTVNTNGAVTGRMTHARPNVAQTPRIGTPFGEECRACWVASDGLVLVGADASGLELCMLAHFMARYDGGAYAITVTSGKKEDGTDVHTVNMKAAGLRLRDSAKTFVYALLYGAGDYKLGMISYDDFDDETKAKFNAKFPKKGQRVNALKALGKKRRAALMSNLPALGKLAEAVKRAAARGYLVGLDGRLLHIRSEHAALNTLLQSAGALVMKKALVFLDASLDVSIRSTGAVAAFVGNIHDEWQIETQKEIADDVGKLACEAITKAGEYFKFRVPLSGSYSVGANWAETH